MAIFFSLLLKKPCSYLDGTQIAVLSTLKPKAEAILELLTYSNKLFFPNKPTFL